MSKTLKPLPEIGTPHIYLCNEKSRARMATNQINKYVWLVDTIHRAKRISFEDINRRWLASDMSEGMEIPKRTFHKWRIDKPWKSAHMAGQHHCCQQPDYKQSEH